MNEPLKGPTPCADLNDLDKLRAIKGPPLSAADVEVVDAALAELHDSILALPPGAQFQVMMPPPLPERVPDDADIWAVIRDAGASPDLDGLPVWIDVADYYCGNLGVIHAPHMMDIVASPGQVRVYRHLARIPATGKLCWLYTTEEPAPLDIAVTAAPPPAP